MRIYIASFFNTRARLQHPVQTLQGLGHRIVSSWLKESREGKGPDAATKIADYKSEELQGFAIRDIGEIVIADLVICDTIDETPRGGREVEIGIALGLGKPFWIVGPRRNVFHYVAEKQFSEWWYLFQEGGL